MYGLGSYGGWSFGDSGSQPATVMSFRIQGNALDCDFASFITVTTKGFADYTIGHDLISNMYFDIQYIEKSHVYPYSTVVQITSEDGQIIQTTYPYPLRLLEYYTFMGFAPLVEIDCDSGARMNPVITVTRWGRKYEYNLNQSQRNDWVALEGDLLTAGTGYAFKASLMPLWNKSSIVRSPTYFPVWRTDVERSDNGVNHTLTRSMYDGRDWIHGFEWPDDSNISGHPNTSGGSTYVGFSTFQKSDGTLIVVKSEWVSTTVGIWELTLEEEGVYKMRIKENRFCPQTLVLEPSDDALLVCLDESWNTKVWILHADPTGEYSIASEIDAGFRAAELGGLWISEQGKVGLTYTDLTGNLQVKYSTASGTTWTD